MKYITRKTSETGKKFQIIEDKAKSILEESKSLGKEIGFKQWRIGYGMAFGGFSSLIFEDKPDLKHFKEVDRNEYMPKLNTKKGKDIQNKLNSSTKVSTDELNKCIGFNGAPFKTIGFNLNNEDFYGFSLKESWNFTPPEDCIEVTSLEYNKYFKKL